MVLILYGYSEIGVNVWIHLSYLILLWYFFLNREQITNLKVNTDLFSLTRAKRVLSYGSRKKIFFSGRGKGRTTKKEAPKKIRKICDH